MDKFIFFKQSLLELPIVGSFWPSSRFLAKRMISNAEVLKAGLVVELGAGTGSITSEILKKLRPGGKLLVFEINPELAKFISESIRDPRLKVIYGDAAEIGRHIKEAGFDKADCVISGLPLANFPRQKAAKILRAVNDSLALGGLFTQFQYSLFSRRLLKKVFGNIKVSFEYRNFPPAFVYFCKKL